MKRISTISALIMFFSSFSAFAASEPIELTDGARVSVGTQVEYFLDSTHEMNLAQVMGQTFMASEKEVFNLGNTPHSVWMRFSLNTAVDKEAYLEVDAPLLSELEVFVVAGDSGTKLFSGGFLNPFKERPIQLEDWLFELDLQKGIPYTIYLKGKSVFPFQVPIAVSDKNTLVETKQIRYLFWGVYIGLMLFALIYNLFIYLSVRERTYLYYLLYIILSVGFYMGLEGFGFKYVWPQSPGFNLLFPILVNFTNVVITLFTFRFLHITKQQKGLFYSGWTFIVIFVLLSVMNLAGIYEAALGLSQLFSLLVCIYYIIVGVVSLRRGISTAKYYLLAWTIYLALVILFILALNNVVPSSFFNTHGIYMGHMAEVALLSFALANRINVLKRENEEKQIALIAQLRENEQLQTKVNRELEHKVAERTADLMAEKERSDNLLLNILPEEVARELKEKGSAEARMMDQVTVLFTDISGFTRLSEQLSPEDLVAELNESFSAFDRIIEKHGIEKIKTIGDSYMAAGGLPIPNQTHAKDVIRACLDIVRFTEERKKQRMAEGKPYFEVRVGVNTGHVIAGIVGVNKFQYDIWGDTVNTASRMENSSEVGRINISRSTYELVKDEFECEYRGKVTAKHKGDLDMYYVVSQPG